MIEGEEGMGLIYVCDDKRHLVCLPYSFINLHIMAKDLKIKRHWFHDNHYDIPKLRIDEITDKCMKVSTREIVKIIKGDTSILDELYPQYE